MTITHDRTTLASLPVPSADVPASKAERKALNRELAEWLRAHGLPTSGSVWQAASFHYSRDIPALADLARADGAMPVRLEGAVMPCVLEPGDSLPDYGARVVSVLADPESGAYWATVTRLADTESKQDEYRATTVALDDLELPAGELIRVSRKPRASGRR